MREDRAEEALAEDFFAPDLALEGAAAFFALDLAPEGGEPDPDGAALEVL